MASEQQGIPFNRLREAPDDLEIGEFDVLFWRKAFDDGKMLAAVEGAAMTVHTMTMGHDPDHAALISDEMSRIFALSSLNEGERIGLLLVLAGSALRRSFPKSLDGSYDFDNAGLAALGGLALYKFLETGRLNREQTTAAPDHAGDAIDFGVEFGGRDG